MKNTIKFPTRNARALKAFLNAISNRVTIIPALLNILFENNWVFKSNLTASVNCHVPDISGYEGKILVPEKEFFNFVGFSKDEFVEIIDDGKSLTLKDSRASAKLGRTNPDEYPKPPAREVANEVPVALDGDALLQFSQMLLHEDEFFSPRSCVFIGNGLMMASNSHIGLCKVYDDKGQKIVIPKAACVMLNGMSCDVSQSDKQLFFTSQYVVFTHQKVEVKYFDMRPYLLHPEGIVYDTISNIEFQNINNLFKSMAHVKSYVPVKVMQGEGGLDFRYFEKDFEQDAQCFLEGNYPNIQDFEYNADLMTTMLRSLAGQNLRMASQVDRCYFIDEENTIGLLMPTKPD